MSRKIALIGCVILLAACTAPKTVLVTRDVVREVQVTVLVTERAGSVPALPTYTLYPTYTAYPTFTLPPAPTATQMPTPTSGPTATRTNTPAPTPTPKPTEAPTRPATTRAPVSTPTPAMTRLEDKDPGPPFAVLVSANRAEENSRYRVTGILRNDGTETYEAIGLNATFFDDQGFRHGPLDAQVGCLLLRPGEECPFAVELGARRVVSFLLHPDGRPTGRQSAAVVLSNLSLADDGLDSVRITGNATNRNQFKVKNVVVCGVLRDASGQIVSLGSTYVLEENIAPGASVSFSARMLRQPFSRYQLYAQAERDWE
jgi:hypothetical protein